ncbi:hypothetical protein [Fictibacillus phosphorivorans]|uniref:hypothetical protein n=1 Tax=Fictibacillus phosphorivorans TaxID=1221500 RepID=UPI0035E525AE
MTTNLFVKLFVGFIVFGALGGFIFSREVVDTVWLIGWSLFIIVMFVGAIQDKLHDKKIEKLMKQKQEQESAN